MSVYLGQTTANNCKTAFSLRVVKSASDDYSFQFRVVVVAFILLIFTARRVSIARTMPWQYVCPSVCLSVCQVRLSHAVLSINGYTQPQRFFHPWVAPPFQFSHTKQDGNIPTGTPLTGASNARVYHFRRISGFIQELMQDRAIVTMEGKQETAPKLSNGTSFYDFE